MVPRFMTHVRLIAIQGGLLVKDAAFTQNPYQQSSLLMIALILTICKYQLRIYCAHCGRNGLCTYNISFSRALQALLLHTLKAISMLMWAQGTLLLFHCVQDAISFTLLQFRAVAGLYAVVSVDGVSQYICNIRF